MSTGQVYHIDLESVSANAATPYILLYDSAGSAVTSGAGQDTSASLDFIAPSTGTYYIDAAMFSWQDSGDYELSVTSSPASPGQSVIGFDDPTVENELPNAGSIDYTFPLTRLGDTSGTTTVSYIVSSGDENPLNSSAFPSGDFP